MSFNDVRSDYMVPTNNKELRYTTQPGRGGRQKSQLVSACFLPFFKLRRPPPTTHYCSTVPSVAAAVAPAAVDVVVVVVAVGGGGVVGVLLLLMASQFMQSLKFVLFSCLANICQTYRNFQPQDPTSTSGSYGHMTSLSSETLRVSHQNQKKHLQPTVLKRLVITSVRSLHNSPLTCSHVSGGASINSPFMSSIRGRVKGTQVTQWPRLTDLES